MTNQEPAEAEVFIPIADHAKPEMPAQELFRRFVGRALAILRRKEAEPFIASDQLQKAAIDGLNESEASPACGSLLAELNRTVELWRAEQPATSNLKLVVLPPCDENNLLETWAQQSGHTVLSAPPRSRLVGSAEAEVPDVSGDGMLVVPRLEEWFIRHQDGLGTVRDLLAALDASARPVVVGCNSWAWSFLRKAASADLVLPDAVTFRAFDAERLHGWFSNLYEVDEGGPVRIRLPQSGEDVLARNEDGSLGSDFLQKLAGRSLGIPWVAWHLWRRSLRSRRSESGEDGGKAADAVVDAEPGERTLWVAAMEEFVLPGADEQTALLVLHALLIHGALTAAELRLVLPTVGQSTILPTLAKAGFLERRGDLFNCRPAAYPAIRDGLISAGYPKDEL